MDLTEVEKRLSCCLSMHANNKPKDLDLVKATAIVEDKMVEY